MLTRESLESVVRRIHAIEGEMGTTHLRLGSLDRQEQRLVVVGEFSVGKSSLINAVLGEAILPVRATPATAVTTELRHGDEPSAWVHYLDGSAKPVEPTANGLRALAADRPDIEKMEMLKICHPAMPKGMVIIDTPGTNDISKTRTEIVGRILPSADSVWMVMSARAPLKASEAAFLKDKLIGADLTRVHFISVAVAPALERMAAGVPITALSASAVAEGLGDQTSRLRRLVSKTQASAADLHAERMSHVVAACERACRDIQSDTKRRRAILGLSRNQIIESIKDETRKMDGAILDVRKPSGKFRRVAEDAKQRSLDQVSETFQRVRKAAELGSTTADAVERLEAELRRELEVIGEELMPGQRSHAVDCEIAATESGFMGRIDTHQNTLLQLIDALAPKC